MLIRLPARQPQQTGLGLVATDLLKPTLTKSATSTEAKKEETSGASLLATLFSGIATAGGAVGAGLIEADAKKAIAKRQAQSTAQIASIQSQTNIELARIQAKAAADMAAAQASMYAADPFRPYIVPVAVALRGDEVGANYESAPRRAMARATSCSWPSSPPLGVAR